MAGLILAAPSSGAGKTTVTLGLLRALKRKRFGVEHLVNGHIRKSGAHQLGGAVQRAHSVLDPLNERFVRHITFV